MTRPATAALVLWLFGSGASFGQSAARADAVRGRVAFQACAACHAVDAGTVILGPSLSGVFGRKAGKDPNFSYSRSLRDSSLIWDAPTLDRFIANPQETAPGTTMTYPGVKGQADRADIVAYLRTLK